MGHRRIRARAPVDFTTLNRFVYAHIGGNERMRGGRALREEPMPRGEPGAHWQHVSTLDSTVSYVRSSPMVTSVTRGP